MKSKFHSFLATAFLVLWCVSSIAVSALIKTPYWVLPALFSLFCAINAAANMVVAHLYAIFKEDK